MSTSCEINVNSNKVKSGSKTESKQLAYWSFTSKEFLFKTSDSAFNQTSTRYFQSVSAHSTMSQEVIPEGLYLRICLYARWVFLHLVTLDQLSLLPLVCITPHKHGYRCRPSPSLPECNNPHVLICMQFIVNLSASWLPPVYSLISNEGINAPSFIARHLKQRIYKSSQLWLNVSWFHSASKKEKSENEWFDDRQH